MTTRMTPEDIATELKKRFPTYELPDLPIPKMVEVVLKTFKKRMAAPGSDPADAHPAIRLYVRSVVGNNPAAIVNYGLGADDEAERFCHQLEMCLMYLVYTQLQEQGGFEKTAVFPLPFSN